MSFTIQTGKGFTAVNCDDCGSYFWMKTDKAQGRTAAGKRISCRDCQIFKGYEVPPWPCARKLDDKELDELEMETARMSISDRKDERTVPTPQFLPAQENRMTLAELREKLKYYFDVTKTKRSEFAEAIGVSGPTIYNFTAGKGISTETRFKLVTEMEKRSWLGELPPDASPAPDSMPEATAIPEPVNPQQKPEFVPPYPDASTLPDDKSPTGQDFYKYLVNLTSLALHEQPDHPNRAKIEENIRENKRLADMTDEQFQSHELYQANPIHKLTQDEKLTCIRMLPIPIVQKLFPHL